MNNTLLFNIIAFGGISLVIIYAIILRALKNKAKAFNTQRIICGVLAILVISAIIVMKTTNFDKINGQLTDYSYSEGKYTGNIINSLPDGYGVLVNHNGDIITGTFIDGFAAGVGKIEYKNGNIYNGELKNNVPDGKGVLTQKSNDVVAIYEGDFVNSIFSGEGKITYPDKKVYSGQTNNFLANGTGTTTLPDGSIYSGQHKNDKFYGEGEFICKTCGHSYKGKFENNFMHGLGKLIDKDGMPKEGKWVYDQFDNKLFSCDNPFYQTNKSMNELQSETETSKSFKN